jgi:hypothetical protein
MRLQTRIILATMFMLAIAGMTAAFLYIQLGPSCRSHLPKVQKSFSCKCSGFEYTRINRASTGHVNSVCFGRASDYVTDFAFWTEWGLARSDHVKVELGIQTLLDSAQIGVIRRYASAFERFKQGWRRVSNATNAPQERVTFSVYIPDPGGKSPVKHETWFAVGDNFLEIRGGLRRELTPKEKILIQNLLAGR